MATDQPKQKVSLASAWRDARELVAVHRQRLALGLGLMLVSRLAGLVMPGTSKLLIDEVIGNRRVDLLWPLALAGGLATLVQAVTGYALSQILGVAAQKAINDVRKSIHEHVLHLPVSHFDSTQTGVLIARVMNDAEGLRNLVGTGIVQLVGGLVTALLGFGVLLYLNWRLTLVVLVVLVLFGVMMTVAFRKLRPLFRERGRIQAEVTGRLGQALGGVREVKAYTAEPAEQASFVGGVDRLFANIRRSMRGVSATTSISTAIVGVVGVIMTLLGGRSILAGEMTLGDFVMYLVFIGLVIGPVVNIASIGTQLSEAFAGMDRLRELREVVREDAADATREPCPSVQGELRFEGVSFAYEPGKTVLEDITFTAPAGSTTALVGSSGGGKTTLAGLVLAFHRPLAGRVLVDGRDLATLRLRDYRSHLGVVLQDNFLFDGTIADNVAFSRPDATRAEVEAVCRTAHCAEFVARFEKGYDTVVGERGVKLSGGQRQRVAIARALLADPRILVLDEATSMLDSESEALIQAGLQQLRQARTTFVIAHRLSTIRSADQILVIEQGRIVERGGHADLLALGGRYRELYDRQHRYEENRFVNPGEDYAPGAVRKG
ncbi:MAG: ABC transporter ATP-binding protein [Planctomycetes bacterium]|nr:ABC transporter ATP-binding protein [Planctomycetota bacterium]